MRRVTFSIIIPALNEEAFLPALLTSLSLQTDRDFEVIVVDGKSKDATVSNAEKFRKKLPRLEIVTSRPSLPLQRNVGAAHARGEWLVFVDADSVLMPYFISRVRAFVQEKKPVAFTSWVQPDTDKNEDALFTAFTNMFLEATLLFKRPFAPGPLNVIRKDTFNSVGEYNEEHAYNEDVELGMRLSKVGITVQLLRETLYIWSMRRIRREGKMKVMQQYIISGLPVLFFKRPFKYMPGYIMGGHLYKSKKKKTISKSTIRAYEKKLIALMRELFD